MNHHRLKVQDQKSDGTSSSFERDYKIEVNELQLHDLIKDMSEIKHQFDLKWERLLKYIKTDKEVNRDRDDMLPQYKSTVGRCDPILVQESERVRMSATVATLNSHLLSVGDV